ncbi:MAG TPA: hypothetical protein VNA20_19010 [Frankiaceae bacterium]|nr:hypothetical protein [Frankiaceae bacterium]
MLRKLAAAAVAVGALALNASPAMADPPTYDCRLRAVQQDDVTGSTYEGVLAGVIVHDSAVTIRCYITVNGVQADTTPTGTGTGVAVTQKQVSFLAGDTDTVRLCIQWSAGTGGTTCVPVVPPQVPPQVVYDTIDGVLWQVWPIVPSICPYLKRLAGTWGTPPGPVVFINSQGDVYVDGEPQWDCPPYDIVWD